jgi:hypothetical protein
MVKALALTVLLGLFGSAGLAKNNKVKHGKGGGHGGQAVFVQSDVVMIREYYRGTNLPPGIEKRLLKKGSLPPGIAKKIQPFPVVLESRLPPLPPGYHRGYYGDSAVIYDPVSRIIYDVADIVVAARQLAR